MPDSLAVVRRRSFLGGAAAGCAAAALGFRKADAQARFPSHNMRVVIPTGQGGGADRLARIFTDSWRKLLGVPFEYDFYPGAGGQVGYEIYVGKRERDGYNLLFGNMGPEMIMYALQKPRYKFPGDYMYFCRIDVDDSCLMVRQQSPFKSIEELVDTARKRTVTVAVSRLPHPASIGVLALAEATKAKFNLVPYGGGNPANNAMLSGEVDCGALPGAVPLGEPPRVLGVFNDENKLAHLYNDAPSVNKVFGTKIPDLPSSRSWALHTEVIEKMPERYELLEKTSRQVFDDPDYKELSAKTGVPWEAIQYGDRALCTRYALAMAELAERYRPLLTGKDK